MKKRASILNVIALICASLTGVYAQEMVAPLDHNPVLKGRRASNYTYKSTALSLPIFEDFTGYSPYPDSNVWADYQVYVNNTMGVSPVSRGVATFDALSQYGKPYDTLINTTLRYADSLTLKPLDLSGNQLSDNIFLSFYCQPQGLGFAPETQDSLLLLFKKSNGSWVKVWSRSGSLVQPFSQVILPVDDTSYYYSGFQFRFVNKASINTNDDVWNIDYIRMDVNRSLADTAIDDAAFTVDPGFMLNDYTYMPYRQFMANTVAELGTQITDSIRNGYGFAQNISYGFTARESVSNTPLFSTGLTSVNINPYTNRFVSQPVYTNTVPIGGLYDRVVFENKFYLQSLNSADSRGNDTVVKEQVFDNYLAYDDGTAEKSYYLNMYPNQPGKIAIEHHLNQPDTLQGVDIYFGRQVPVGSNKTFSIAVYQKLIGVNGSQSDVLVQQQDLLFPAYLEVNDYYTYKLDQPVTLPAGTFYIATIQPASSGSDSLYFGLDANRVQGNHAYYNVDGTWVESIISGAIMIRPLVGQVVFNTGVEQSAIAPSIDNVTIYPNPATDKIVCNIKTDKKALYSIIDMQGRSLLQGILPADKSIDVSQLVPGIYFIRLEADGLVAAPQKIIKQ